jgi:uncharacterized protein YjiS (DUF1127 family)
MFTGIVTQAIKACFGRIAAMLRYRRAIHQLQQLDDRMLADIGLSRMAIGDAVRGGRRL